MDIGEFESALVNDPFNATLRMQYGHALLSANRVADAAAQFELVAQQQPDTAQPHIGIALTQLADGQDKTARQTYIQAKNLEGFEAQPQLDALAANAQAGISRVETAADNKAAVLNNVVDLASQRPRDKTTFADVAGMDALKKTLRMQIIEPFKNVGLFKRFRKQAGGGVLLYGPPGCGKTLIARAIAGECNAEFQSIGISDVLNMWIGESERNLALIFEQARTRKPCVLFFDELEALAYSRAKASSSAARTVVNEFLAQLDGFNDDNDGMLVLAATNMPWDVDAAMKRPGRFSRQIFVPPPDQAARAEILKLKLTDIPCDDINYQAIAEQAHNYSGADMDGLIDLAKEAALSDILESGQERALAQADFVQALAEVVPTTLDWLSTARNLVKFSGADRSYKDVEKYLKQQKLL